MAMQQITSEVGFRPLYSQVKEELVRRLVDGTWQPGTILPSEVELARQLRVSQGTVRKALDSMTSENLLVRRQGRGTFVAEPEESRILFQYFKLLPDSGESRFPQSIVLSSKSGKASATQAEFLDLVTGDPVWVIERVRSVAEKPILVETIILPGHRFPGFDQLTEIPNNVYRLYSSQWGITIGQAEEKLKAISASAEDAHRLNCDEGEPLLAISRVARDLEKQPVELRNSRCLTTHTHYSVNLK